MRTQATTLDPTCLRCLAPMTLTVSGCPLLPRRFLAECPACGRTVAVTLTAQVLRAGRGCTESPPPKKRAGASQPRRGFMYPIPIFEAPVMESV